KAWPVLVLFPVWGRCSASLTACLSNYARPEGGLGRPFVDLAGTRELYLSGFTALLLSSLFMGVKGLIIALVAALFAVWGSWLWQRRLGGVTGDVLGAVIEITEVLGLAVAVIWFQ
ncbi:MAG: adenosylcobinamide-GDP ribazoletransferase, partial [Pseudomonadota bacterium]